MNRTTDEKESGAESVASAEPESTFRRWSRRKREARVAARRGVAKPEPATVAATEVSEPVPERALTDADMPPVEKLDERSDYSLFMSPGVSEALRHAALRRLFSAPQFNELCELEGEFFDARNLGPLGNIVTYDMRAALERELEKAKATAKDRLNNELTNSQESGGAVRSAPSQQVELDSNPGKDSEADKRGDA